MSKPAARIGDMHVCPKTTGNVPHVGGPIIQGSANVFIGGMPAAKVGDKLVCIGPPDRVRLRVVI
ncbi:PAAR domain-containing protein [Rheinheimera sp.]|uniref:PAAR domain-containing protein n=1 Tax=Rheinheimera sp. TaxID=1869214 RepID=UPI00404845A6